MQYRFYYKVWLKYSSGWYYNALQLRLFLNGIQYNVPVKDYNANEKAWSYEGTTEWYTVSKKQNGSVPFYAKLYDASSGIIKTTSATYNLTVIAAGSYMDTITSFDVDNGVTIHITKYDSTSVDTLVISYGGTNIKTISGITNGTKVVFTEAELTKIYGLMSAVNSGAFTFALTAIVGSTTLATHTMSVTGNISNANPTFTESNVSYADINTQVADVTQNPLYIVQEKSILSVGLLEATPKKGATITRYDVTVNGVVKTVTEAQEIFFGQVNSANDVTLTAVVTDSRGNTATVEKVITMLAWNAPTFTATVERINNYETDTIIKPRANFASVDGKNDVTVTYRSKKVGEEYGGSAEIENAKENTVALDNNYDFWVSVTIVDLFGGVATSEYFVPKGKFPLFIDTEKEAVGINEFPSKGEALRVAGGVACFDEGIVLKSGNKSFKITIDDSGALVIAEIK